MLKKESIRNQRKKGRGWNLLGVVRVFLLEFLENSDLYSAGVPVLGDRSNDLNSDSVVGVGVDSLHNLAESSLPQEAHRSI